MFVWVWYVLGFFLCCVCLVGGRGGRDFGWGFEVVVGFVKDKMVLVGCGGGCFYDESFFIDLYWVLWG